MRRIMAGLQVRRLASSLCIILILGLILSNSLLAESNIEELIRVYLKEHYPWEEIEVKDLFVSGNIPEGEVEQIYIDKRPPGKALFRLHYKNGEKLIVTASIRAFDRVIMALRPQSKGYVLKKDDLHETIMDVTKIPRGAIREISEATGKTLRRSIISNSPLTIEMLSEGAAVKKGSRVMIIAESPSFVITAAGELKENGYVGSTVKAVNLTSKKMIRGILINENTLKVEF